MPYLLNLFYILLLAVASPWLLYRAIGTGRYREGYGQKLLGLVPPRRPGKEHEDERPCLWLHAVSVGEVNLLAPLLKMLAAERPDWECVVSTTTVTGMALARKKYPNLTVFYCPLDFSWAVRAAMRRVKPRVLVLAELELWPNLVRAAREHGAAVAVVNGRLSEHSFRGYRRIRWLAARVLRQIDLVAVQDATYAERFLALGARPETVHVTGSMKFDGAETDRNNPNTERLARLAGFADDDVVFLAGSTQEPEEAAAIESFRRLAGQWPKLRLVLVPRHPERFEAVARLLDQSGLAWQRRSQLAEGPLAAPGVPLAAPGVPLAAPGVPLAACQPVPPNTRADKQPVVPETAADKEPVVPQTEADKQPVVPRVLLVDCVGELGAWWGTARIAFVGGSLGSRGGQNMIEPAAYGAAVSFGPNTRNFRDIVAMMLARQAAVVVQDADELAVFVRRCLEEPAWAGDLGRRAQSLATSQQGATRRTCDLLAAVAARPVEAARDGRAAA